MLIPWWIEQGYPSLQAAMDVILPRVRAIKSPVVIPAGTPDEDGLTWPFDIRADALDLMRMNKRGVLNMKLCQHCHSKPANRARGLCAKCYSDFIVRSMYPTKFVPGPQTEAELNESIAAGLLTMPNTSVRPVGAVPGRTP